MVGGAYVHGKALFDLKDSHITHHSPPLIYGKRSDLNPQSNRQLKNVKSFLKIHINIQNPGQKLTTYYFSISSSLLVGLWFENVEVDRGGEGGG